jgi:transposase
VERAEEQARNLKVAVEQHARARFGRRSEQQPQQGGKEPDQRGQRRGRRGHGRRRDRFAGLREVHVIHDVSEAEKTCPVCGRRRQPIGEDVSEELDVELVVRRVMHHRPVYAASCDCPGTESVVRGAAPTKLIPRGCFSVGTTAFAVTARYLWGLPLHRITTILRQHGADVPDGTLVGVFAATQPLLVPLYSAICERNRHSEWLHADETTWRQLWLTKGKRGYIWCFVGPDTTVYLFDPGRDHGVILRYLRLDGTAWGGRVIDLMCDFLPSYDKAAKVANATQRRLELSRCWSHYRRLFLEIPAHHPGDQRVLAEVEQWLGMIADLFHLHHQRDLAADGSDEQDQAMATFRGCLQEMEEVRARHLRRRKLAPELRHVLDFGATHWEELIRCARDPHHPMDNNRDERQERLPVVIRKNAYGSGARWAADQACQVWTIGQTALQHGRPPLALIQSYFEACAAVGGAVPPDWDRFLPWGAAVPQPATALEPELGNRPSPTTPAGDAGALQPSAPCPPTEAVVPPEPRHDRSPDRTDDPSTPAPTGTPEAQPLPAAPAAHPAGAQDRHGPRVAAEPPPRADRPCARRGSIPAANAGAAAAPAPPTRTDRRPAARRRRIPAPYQQPP